MGNNAAVSRRYELLTPILDEKQRRILVAVEATVLGHGGISEVATSTGVSRQTISAGMADLAALRSSANEAIPSNRIRRTGGGRKKVTEHDSTLMSDLESLVEPTTRGDPESPLRWTCKSLRVLADELHRLGHVVSYVVVGKLLKKLGYSLQANSKTIEGSAHPDRNAQFEHINASAHHALDTEQPVISVDTKKKELVGQYKNQGREWQPQGKPVLTNVHDFIDPELGRANPYGVYDVGADTGWVNVGTDNDTSEFAVETIRRWWFNMGKQRYPNAAELTITADGGGSNGHRVRLWKLSLQKLADESGMTIQVCHFPPGTSKWNKIEHRLFSFISMNWRGRPLVSHEVVVNLIGSTTTRSGLKVHAELDTSVYEKGIHVSDEQFATINLERDSFHGDWNYRILPGRRVSGNI
jgi:hypothetical protein